MPTASKPPAELCPQCGKKPGNPKFCSKSCAAAFNNRAKPKRGPQGKCVDCGAAIPTVKKRCPDCAAKAAEAKRRIAENIQTFRTPNGDVRELPVPKAWVRDSTVYEPHPSGGREFTPSDSCDVFLDALLGVVFARPAYIRPDDILRYAAWIDAFRSHVIDRPWENRRDFRGPVAALPLRQLGYALRDWVDTVIRSDNHALFPTLAVDAALFINDHAFGHSDSGGESWRITGLVTPDPSDPWMVRERFSEPRLKHEITNRLKGTLTRCGVPPGGSVPNPRDAPTLLGAGESFVFAIERCHLTHENVADLPCVRALEGDPPRFDIAADLWFRGVILLNAVTGQPIASPTGNSHPAWGFSRHELVAELPVRWITGVNEWLDGNQGHRCAPVPRYAVEGEPNPEGEWSA